jgi:hypothetical protein
VEANALHFKILADQPGKIHIACDHITPDHSGRAILEVKRIAKFIKNFARKKGDLPFIIVLIIEEAITSNAMTGHTLNASHLQNGVFVWFAPVVAKKVMASRNVQVTDFHRDNAIITARSCELQVPNVLI